MTASNDNLINQGGYFGSFLLADQGAWQALAARDAERLDRVAGVCRKSSGQAIPVQTDVADQAACQCLIASKRYN